MFWKSVHPPCFVDDKIGKRELSATEFPLTILFHMLRQHPTVHLDILHYLINEEMADAPTVCAEIQSWGITIWYDQIYPGD